MNLITLRIVLIIFGIGKVIQICKGLDGLPETKEYDAWDVLAACIMLVLIFLAWR